MRRGAALAAASIVAGCAVSSPAVQSGAPADAPSGDLAKAAQNPIADLVSLPFQNNTTFDWGPRDEVQNVLNVQPVVPFGLNDDWNVITRTIVPLVSQPVIGGHDDFGLGDSTFTAFFSPTNSGALTLGVGPVVLLPTATARSLGAEEWGGGVSAVALTISGPWVAGGLISNVWSFESSAVDLLTVQPFVNYNLDDGWYLVTAPIATADWNASSDERWTLPLGGGVGRVFKPGKIPLNCNVQYYNNVEHPTLGGQWQLRLQVQLLFPKG